MYGHSTTKRKEENEKGMGIDGSLKRSKGRCMATPRQKERKRMKKGWA